jgi:hypothetical protein
LACLLEFDIGDPNDALEELKSVDVESILAECFVVFLFSVGPACDELCVTNSLSKNLV